MGICRSAISGMSTGVAAKVAVSAGSRSKWQNPPCPLLMCVIAQVSEGGSIALTATTITRQCDLIRISQKSRATKKKILWSNGPWLGQEIVPAWENFYETQGVSPFAAGEMCVLTAASSSPPLVWLASASRSPAPLRKENGPVAAREWGNASKTRSSLLQSTVEHDR